MRGVRVVASTTGSLVRLTMPFQNVCASHVQGTTVIATYSQMTMTTHRRGHVRHGTMYTY